MAQGTFVLFHEFSESIGDGRIDLDTDTFRVGLTTLQAGGTPTITAADAVPTWGAGGTTNLAASEVAAGGGYTAGGNTLTSVTWSQTTGTATFDAADTSWTASAGSPTTIKTAVIYDDTATNKDALGFIDMTADGTTAISLVAGDINIVFNASGIFTLS